MIKQRLYPDSIEELKAIVNNHSQEVESIVCQAGHFLVYYDHTEDLLLPGIAKELEGPRYDMIKKEIGHFPELTWEIGIDLLSSIANVKRHIFTIVNDWQYLPQDVDRCRFYKNFRQLPKGYREAIELSRKKVNLLKPQIKNNSLDTGDFFSEQTLRNKYGKHIKDLIGLGQLPKKVIVNSNNGDLSCNLFDTLGRKQEVYCSGKRENCIQEVAELVYTIKCLSGCSVLLNLHPLVCKQYVEAGSELSYELFNPKINTIINIGMKSSGILHYDDLFSNCNVTIHVFDET